MSKPSDPRARKPLTLYGVFLVVLAAGALLLIPPLRPIAIGLLALVFVGIGLAYAMIWGRIYVLRRKRRRIEARR